MTNNEQEGYIVEFTTCGKSVKVTAFDPVNLREVSIAGSARASRKYLAEVAIRKLQYMLAKDKNR